jgi:hypothetical protein
VRVQAAERELVVDVLRDFALGSLIAARQPPLERAQDAAKLRVAAAENLATLAFPS